jgi:hypothetical protein
VDQDDPAPARREYTTQHREHDEGQVEKQDGVGGKAVEHGGIASSGCAVIAGKAAGVGRSGRRSSVSSPPAPR